MPRNWKLDDWLVPCELLLRVPPSGGCLEIGNDNALARNPIEYSSSSPFGGMPRNWKLGLSGQAGRRLLVPPSGGCLEIGNINFIKVDPSDGEVPPSGGCLEIGNGQIRKDRYE